MPEQRVLVFFYGSFISAKVLKAAHLVPERVDVARLWGFDIRIGPLANVVRSDRCCVYGIVCDASHSELAQLYGQDWVGTYVPVAVVVETLEGASRPALCYVSPATRAAPPPDDYLDKIVDAAKDLGFPSWYVDHLESFRR